MQTISADADVQLPSLLDHVERGESVIITRNGKTIARIIPAGTGDAGDLRQTMDAIEAFRKTMPRLSLDEILSARHEGHER